MHRRAEHCHDPPADPYHSTSSAPMMSWTWYLMWNLTWVVVRRLSRSDRKTSLYLDFLTMASTALRPAETHKVCPELRAVGQDCIQELLNGRESLSSCLPGEDFGPVVGGEDEAKRFRIKTQLKHQQLPAFPQRILQESQPCQNRTAQHRDLLIVISCGVEEG
ncbi:hypothetical protein JZ751_027274 [Albula glossodonta]|uniref:Uncharacterized protein n=1 Tax=Albula glossodonta TaxID=121402 RepID=A0A8T2N0K5_9TELE|nr:hypothetical protein JZ751_027274 [Albula glossodonta]